MARRGSRSFVRLVALLATFVLLLVGIVFRLVQLQVVRAQPLELMGARQRIHRIELPATRGAIFDRNMTPLALSTEARTIYADPQLVTDPIDAATKLAPILGLDQTDLIAKLSSSGAFVYLLRDAPLALARRVQALNLPYIGMYPESARVYPSGALAGQLLGFVGTDGEGLSGLESEYDRELRGTPGYEIDERDPQGQPIPQGRNSVVAPVPGAGLVLTIDSDIQFFTEQALARGVRQTHARGGVAIVLDPKTGDVLAMANYPSLDPNHFGDATPDAQRNRAVTDAYEPGSVNKIITASAAIDAGLATPEDRLVVPGRLRVADGTFHDDEPHGTLHITYAQAIAISSNIGTIEIAQRIGARRVFAALRAFGLGTPTGIGLPGESAGVLLPLQQWSGTSIATIPIGQGIAASPLQVAAAYATIANDGVRVRPRIIAGTVRPDGTVAPRPASQRIRVVRPYTAAQVRGMLVGVVEHGTGTRAQIPGYLVAGKTGTARIPLVGRPGYSGDIMTTFAGMAPADHPRLVVLVALDNPRPRFAALTAAPVFREIMQFCLGRLGIPPTIPVHEAGLAQRRARAA